MKPITYIDQYQNPVNISDASELSSARFSSDSARAEGLSARLGSAREIFEPARLAKIGHIRAKIGSDLAMKRNRLGQKNSKIINSKWDLT